MRQMILNAALISIIGGLLSDVRAQDPNSPAKPSLQGAEKKDNESSTNTLAAKYANRPDMIEQGLNDVNAFCSRCHGRHGRGGKGPDLTSGVFRHVRSDEDILRVMANGIPGTGMPGFGAGLDEVFLPAVAYIRSEAAKRKDAHQPPAGNSNRGYELFKQHKCAGCHWTGGEGGRIGTDLSKIAATPDHVRSSLTEPDSQIDASYQLLRILLDDGRVLTGRRLYENTYYVLLMDPQENLHTIDKSHIEQLSRPHQSLMPSFTKELNKVDVEDLTTYILSLRKEPSP